MKRKTQTWIQIGLKMQKWLMPQKRGRSSSTNFRWGDQIFMHIIRKDFMKWCTRIMMYLINPKIPLSCGFNMKEDHVATMGSKIDIITRMQKWWILFMLQRSFSISCWFHGMFHETKWEINCIKGLSRLHIITSYIREKYDMWRLGSKHTEYVQHRRQVQSDNDLIYLYVVLMP